MSDHDPFLNLLHRLNLSRTEQAVVARFEENPTGRGFLPIADILGEHGYKNESIELLSLGVERHPVFTVARVILARELYDGGMIEQSLSYLEDSRTNLSDNVLAQKLFFKIHILLGRLEAFKLTRDHMVKMNMIDAGLQKLSDEIAVSGLQRARDSLIQDLRSHGASPILPAIPSEAEAEDDGVEPIEKEEVRISAPSEIEGFHVVPLNEVFQTVDDDGRFTVKSDLFELDSTTLADIYTEQGHYGKALNMYKRLLRMSPHSDLLRRKVKELSRLSKQQKEDDFMNDPELVDSMEQIHIIDEQIQFLQSMLNRLGG